MKQTLLFSLLLVTLLSCSKQYHIADVNTRTYRIEKASYPVDTKIAAIIEPYKLKLGETMDEVIGYCDEELVKGKPSSNLTNWFADVLLDETSKLVSDPIDFAIQNYGGIRNPVFSKGNVTVGKIYELMPFDNIIYIVEMDGSTVQKLFDKIAETGGWPVSRTISMEIAYGKAKNIFINNAPLDIQKKYSAAIPDYLANGGDNMDFFQGLKTYNTGALIRDLIINNVKQMTAAGQTIKSNTEQRIRH